MLMLFAIGLCYPAAAFPIHGAAIVVGLCIVLAAATLAFQSGNRNPTLALLPALAFAGLHVAGVFRAPSFALARPEAMTVLVGIGALTATAAGVSCWPRNKVVILFGKPVSPIPVLVAFLLVCLTVSAAFGVYQVIGPASLPKTFAAMERQILDTVDVSDPLRDGLLHATREARAAGTLGAPNLFATLCVFALPLAAAGFILSDRRRFRVAHALAAAVLLAAIYFSKSSGGFLAAAGGLILFALLAYGWKTSAQTFRRTSTVVVVATTLAVAVLLIVIVFVPQEKFRWFAFGSLRQRIYYWQTAWEIFKRAPFFGSGPAAFEVLYPQYRIAGSNETRHAHSWLFEYASAVGIAGLCAFATMLIVAGASAIRDLKSRKSAGEFAPYLHTAALLAALVAITAHGLVEYTFFFRETLLLFFIGLGALLALSVRDATPAKPARSRSVVPALVMLLVFGMIIPLEITPLKSQLLRDSADDALREDNDSVTALAEANRAIAADPRDERTWELRAYLKDQSGDSSAIADYQKAIALNSHSARFHEALALLYSRRKDYSRAIIEQGRAIALHPLDANHYMTLSEIEIAAGDTDAARAQLKKTFPLLLPTEAEQRRRNSLANKLQVIVPRH